MRYSAVIAAAALLALASLGTTRPAAANDPAQTMLIVDGSGSMWGTLDPDKRPKIDIVRERLLTKVAPGSQQKIGLTSFGHRRKGDCSDVEIIAPADVDRTVLNDTLLKLNPRGKSPLAAALREAAAALVPERPANMIVINDGVDNCRQDPCAAAADIAKTAPGVAIHMIAIGVEPVAQTQLACVAEQTRGSFHDVTTSDELVAAIDDVAAIAMLAPSPAASGAAAPLAPAAPTTATLQAKVSLSDSGGAVNLPVLWTVYQSGRTAVLAESTGPALTARLDPGTYDIEASYGRMRIKSPVEVAAGQTVDVKIPLNAGRLKVSVKGGNEVQPAPPTSLLIAVEPEADGKPQPQAALLVHRNALSEVLPAGSYTVSLTDGAVRQTKTIALAAGNDANVEFTTATGRLELSAGLREDGGAIEDVTFAISEDDPDSPNGRREVARSRAPSPSFTLPAGTYYASAHSGDGEVRQRIAVGAGDVVKRALILPLVPVKVSSQIAGEKASAAHGISYRVTALDGDRRELVRSVKPDLNLTLLPGRYRIAAHLDAHDLKVAKEITVVDGQAQDVDLQFTAGEVSLKLGPGVSASVSDTSWEIVDGQGKRVWQAMATEATALLPPGRYTVHLQRRDQNLQAAFEVAAGERKVVQIGTN